MSDPVVSRESAPKTSLQDLTGPSGDPSVSGKSPHCDLSNPLLTTRYRIPFGEIKAEHIEPAIAALITDAKSAFKRIVEQEAPRTFENTMLALELATEPLSFAHGIADHINSVATYPEFRAAHLAVQTPVSEFFSSIVLDPAIWKAVSDYAATDEAGRLKGAQRRLLEKTMSDFKREGANLPPEEKTRLSAVDAKLSELTAKFKSNVLDATNAFDYVVTDESKLKGLPPSARAMTKAAAEAKGLKDAWRFTLQGPSYVAAMTYLDDASIREILYKEYNTRASGGSFDNTPLVSEILKLRRERAGILGFDDFADLTLNDRMAKTGKAAKEFVGSLIAKVEAQAAREQEALLAFRRSLEGPEAPSLSAWDVAYYTEKQRQAQYDFDEEALRPYFSVPNVIEGVFRIAQRLYGIRIEEKNDLPVWDPQVTAYSVSDQDGTLLGAFYVDLYPREAKRGGAWMNNLIDGRVTPEGFEPHLGLFCANLTPGIGGKPALLTHDEVTTLFHEFGHLLHQLLSKVELRSLSGTNVAWDFVELPSQIMENWCWEKEALDLFAAHYETGQKVPDDLLKKMLSARNYWSANATLRQLGFAYIDLKLHTEYSEERDGDVRSYVNREFQRFSPAPLPKDYAMITSFSHLFSSPVAYASGYYSYKWAEVLDADAFTRFQHEGIFNPETGASFRNEILSKGNSEDAAVLFRNFMGRDPDPSALLVRSGLV